MKKWISLLLILALILGVMAGCGSSQSEDSAAASAEKNLEESQKTEEAQGEGKTDMLAQTAEQAKNAANEAAQMQSQAQEVNDLIDGLGEITPGSGAALDEARSAYDALPENVRALVSSYSQLEAAEASYQEATSAVTAVQDAIDGLGEITVDSRDAMDAAWDLYDALPETSKEYVENLSTLEDAEDTYKGKVEEQGLADIQALIDAGEYQQAMDAGEAFLQDHTVSDESAFRELIDSAHLGLAWQYYNANYLEATQDELDDLRENAESETVLAGVQTLQDKLNGWLAYIEPSNKYVFADTTGSGYGELTVLSGDTPLYVVMEKVNNPSSYISFYVRANSEVFFSSIEDGDYYVKYATGPVWYGESELFGSQTSAYQADDIMSFETTYSGNYVYYSVITLTLYSVEGGNMTSTTIDPGQMH